MKKFLFISIFVSTYFAVCGNPTDSLKIMINGINLSEDMSTLSSKNDEVLLLLYSYDTLKLKEPLLSQYFVLDSVNRKKVTSIPTQDPLSDVLLMLAELDTDRSPDQVEKLIRKNFKEIIDCLDKRDLIRLQNYIGDDDIMGIKVIRQNDLLNKTNFSFQGRYKLDKYLYRIEIRKSP